MKDRAKTDEKDGLNSAKNGGNRYEWLFPFFTYVDFLIERDGEFDLLSSAAVMRAIHSYGYGNTHLTLVLPYMIAEYCDYAVFSTKNAGLMQRYAMRRNRVRR